MSIPRSTNGTGAKPRVVLDEIKPATAVIPSTPADNRSGKRLLEE